jgi:3-oxoacyl-ACP reductase-like protein
MLQEEQMGLFKNLMNKIFHAAGNAEAPPDAYRAPSPATASAAASSPAAAAATAATAPAAPQGPVDIAAVLDRLAASNPQKLDWKHSIVDLMKLVGMDSSLAERKELAADLKYTGDTNDSASMNMWLHKEVMRKLAENGGKVPADLLAR